MGGGRGWSARWTRRRAGAAGCGEEGRGRGGGDGGLSGDES